MNNKPWLMEYSTESARVVGREGMNRLTESNTGT